MEAFQIELEDRITQTQLFALTQEEVDRLIEEGITSAGNLQNFRFFTNDFDTETQGVDVVATWTPAALDGKTDFSFLFNQTDTEVTRFNPDTLDQTRIRELQEALPEQRYTLTVNHRIGDRMRVLGRLSYFDDWFDSEDVAVYGGEHTVDLEFAYTFSQDVTITVGGQNVLDTFPDENTGARSGVGNLYSQFSPFGFNGAFWYARLKYDWTWNR